MQFEADDALVEPPTDSYSEFDATATPNQPGPLPSSPPPEAVQEPPRESGEEQAAEPPDPSEYAPAEFDARHREPFMGLMFLGHLTEEFTFWGHRFTISTPTQNERLQIGQVISGYRNTWSEDQAWMTAMVAAYLIEIDGTPLPEPVVKGNRNDALRQRYDWVVENVYPQVLSRVYEKCLALDKRVTDILAAMGEA